MKNLGKKFNKLVKHFDSADKDLQFEYEWSGGYGNLSRSNLGIVYNKSIDADTYIGFDLNASTIVEVDEGDYMVPATSRTLEEVIEIDVNEVVYQGQSISLTIAQQYRLEDIIREQISID